MRNYRSPRFALWEDRRGEGGPGLHALVIGVSYYPNTRRLKFEQLSGMAMSAARFARWLRDTYNNRAFPLRTIRVLLSPTDEEAARIRDDLGAEAPEATTSHVNAVLGGWRDDFDEHAENLTVLYAAGHGCYTPSDGGFVALEDFGDAPQLLNNALNVNRLIQTMGAHTARTNLYFVDACRSALEEQVEFELGAGIALDAPRTPALEPHFWRLFSATAPGADAWVIPKENTTVFGEALLAALNGDALDVDPETGQLGVMADDLHDTTKLNVECFARRRHREYGRLILKATPQATGSREDLLFHVPQHLDDVELTIQLDPDSAARFASGLLFRDAQYRAKLTFTKHPSRLPVQPGPHSLTLTSPAERFTPVNPSKFVRRSDPHWPVSVDLKP